MARRKRKKVNVTVNGRAAKAKDVEPDWQHACNNCGAVPTMPITGMCGPCTFGEADTSRGQLVSAPKRRGNVARRG